MTAVFRKAVNSQVADCIRIFFIADIVGEPGRQIVTALLPDLRKKYNLDLVVANGENAAGGKGLTPKCAEELWNSGIDVLTLGNHSFDRKEIFEILSDRRILRPANYPAETPGQGYNLYYPRSQPVAVINLLGRVFLSLVDCPFRWLQDNIAEIRKTTPIILVDFHAEITSEKQAFGYFADGKVSAVIGTHTHVPTADERILANGCGYITDCGMTGPLDGVIGIEKEIIIKKYLTLIPQQYRVATGSAVMDTILLEIGFDGKTQKIIRQRYCHDFAHGKT